MTYPISGQLRHRLDPPQSPLKRGTLEVACVLDKPCNLTRMRFYEEQDLSKQYAGQQEAFGPGLSNIKDKEQFLRQYNRSMQDTALSLLSTSQQEAKQKQAIFAQGNLAQDKPVIQKVSTGLASLDQKIQLVNANYQLAKGQYVPTLDETVGEDYSAIEQASQQKLELEHQRAALLTQCPLLSRIENTAEFNKLSEPQQAAKLKEACGGVIGDIATTRENIANGKLNLWSLAPIIGVTTEGLGIQPEQMKWVSQKGG
jgi:hypothetical protein